MKLEMEPEKWPEEWVDDSDYESWLIEQQKFIHFTDLDSAHSIIESMHLEASSIVEGIYAVHVGGTYAPGTQKTQIGRAKNRDYAVIFTTRAIPHVVFEEETIWHGDYIKLVTCKIVTAEEAVKLLESVPIEDSE